MEHTLDRSATVAVTLFGWLRTAKRWRRRQLAMAASRLLDDRMLKDIGMHRSEIGSVVSGLGRGPSRIARGQDGRRSASALSLSRPAQASLALRPAGSLSHPR